MDEKILIREGAAATGATGAAGFAGGLGGLILGGLAGYALSRWNGNGWNGNGNNGCGCGCGCNSGAQRVFTQGDVDNLLATKNTEYNLGSQISQSQFQSALLAEQANTAQARALCDTTYEIVGQIGNVREAAMQQTFELSRQMASCCCELKQEIAGVVSAFQAEKINALRDEILFLKLRPTTTTTTSTTPAA